MAGRGTIEKRTLGDGRTRYVARVWHQRKSKAKVFSQRKLAEKWISATNLAIEERGVHRTSQQPLGEYLMEWLDTYKKPDVRPHVLESYREMLERYITSPANLTRLDKAGKSIPRQTPEALRELRVDGKTLLCDMRLSDLAPEHFQRLYNAIREGERGKRVAQYLHAILIQAFKQAVSDHKLSVSPLSSLKRPKAAKREKPVVLDPEGAAKFLGAIADHRHRAMWTLCLLHGTRPGEALALRWENVDLNAGTVAIAWTITDARTRGAPKTEAGTRTITLSRAAKSALAAHALASGARVPSGVVFPSMAGTVDHLRNITRRFRAVLKAQELPIMPLYNLRHSCASILLSRGESVVAVAQMLGHKDPSVTLKFYAWALPQDAGKLAASMDAMLDNMQGAQQSK